MRRLAAIGMLLVLAACGEESGDPGSKEPDGEKVPITHRAVAAVALEHLPQDTTTRMAMYADQETPKGTVGAELRYGGDGEYDGDYVGITVSPVVDHTPCREVADGCEKLKADDGSPMFVTWQELEPEEDPGIVYVVVVRKDESTSVSYSGPAIEGDPRKQELPIAVDDLIQVAQDPRLQPMTSPDAVEAGEKLDKWEGGEPDPAAYDVVPSRDQDMAAAYVHNRGGYADFTRIEPSPLKGEFGKAAIGARLHSTGELGMPKTIDIVASKDGPAWLGADPCASKHLPHCVKDTEPINQLEGDAHGEVVRAPLYFLWKPGDDGEAWAVQRRDDQVVAFHWTGVRMPEGREAAQAAVDWLFTVRNTLGNSVLGLTTLKSVTDSEVVAQRWQD